MAAELAIIAKLQDEASSGIRTLRGEVEGLGQSGGVAAQGFQALQTVGAAALAALATAAVGVGAAIVGSISVASSFEDQIAILSTAAQGAGTSLDSLRDAAMAVGSDVSLVGVNSAAAADAMTILYKAGLSTGEIFGDLNGYMAGHAELGGALRAAIDGAAASELEMGQAAELAAIALATFGGNLTTTAERSEFVNVAMNNFVQTADASVASVSQLASSFESLGPTAAQFGFTLQDTNTALALLSTRGITGAEAGTALKSMFTNLMRETPAVTGALNDLNVSLYNTDGTMREMPEILADLGQAIYGTKDGVAALTEEQRNQYIITLAGAYGMKAMAVLLMEGTAGWEAMETAIANAATIQEVAAARTQTFSGAMEALKGVIETIQIGIGSAFLPVLTSLARAFAELASQHMKAIVDGFEAVGTALSNFFAAIMGGTPPLQALSDAIAGLATAFGMPAEQAQALGDAIAGFLATVVAVIGPIAQAITSFVSWKDVLVALGIAIGSVVIPLLIGLVQVFAPIIATIAAVILVVAALRNAWESDFLGIRSAVEGAVETFGRFVEAIRVFTDTGASIQQMLDSLNGLPAPLQALAVAVATFLNALRDGASLTAAFQTGLETLKQLIFNWAGAEDWSGVGAAILDKIASAFTNLGDRAATTAAGILNWITTSVNSIDWNAVGQTIINGIAAAITAVVGGLVVAGTAIAGFITGFFTNESLATAGTNIVAAIGNAISGAAAGIATGLDSIRQAIFDWAGADSWLEVGQTIIGKIADAFLNLGDKVAEVQAGIFNWIADAINGIDWHTVGESIINGIVAAITAVVGLLVTAGTAIVNYFIGFFTNDEIGPAGANIITALGNAISEFASGISDGLASVRDAIFEWAGVEDWSGVAEKIAEMIGEKLGEMGEAVSAQLSEWQTAIFDWAGAEDWEGVATHIAEMIGEKLGEMGETISAQLSEWQTAIFDWADAEDWSGVAEHIAEMIGQALADAATTLWNGLESWEQAIFDWAGAADWVGVGLHIAEMIGQALADAAGMISDKLGEWEQAIFDWVGATSWIEVGQTIVEMAVEGLTEWASAAADKVDEWFGDMTAAIEGIDWYQIGYDISNFIVTGLIEFGTLVSEKITGWYTSIQTFVEGKTWDQIALIILGAIALGLGEFADKAGTAVSTWKNDISAKITEMIGAFSELGGNIVDGIISGITAMAGAVADAIRGIIAGALGAGEQEAGARSPARAFMPLGSDITAGVAVGMLQATGMVVDAIQQIAGQLQTEGAKAFGEAMKALAEGLAAGMNAILDLSAFPGVGGSFLDNLRTVVDMLAEMVAEVNQANIYGAEALTLLGTFVDVAGGIADLILPLITALIEIGRFQPPSAETFTAALAQLALYLSMTVQHVVAANQYSTLVLEGLSAFLGVMEQIADTVGPFLAALVDINAFGTVRLDFFHEGIAHLWYTMLMLVGKVQELAVLGTETLARMEGFLEVVQAIADLVGPFIEALYEMNAFGTVHLDFFHEGLAHLAYVMLMVVAALNEANTFGTAALEAVRLFAETAGAIADMIGPMIEGLISINALDGTMNEVAYHAVYFRNGVRALVDALASAAALFTTGTLQHVQLFAETAGAIAEIIVPAVEGLLIIGTLTGDLNYIGIQATYFRNGLRTIVSALESAAVLFTAALLNHVQLFAETAGRIMEVIAPAIEGFALISTLTGEVNYIGIQATYLRNGLRTIVTAISSAAELFTAGLLQHTQLFAETAGEIVDLIGEAIGVLALLANYVAAAGLESAAAAFATDLTTVINLIVNALEAAGLLANEAVVKAGDLAGGLSDLLGLIEDGVEALTALASYVTVSNLSSLAQLFAADLVTALLAIVSALEQAGVLASASVAAAVELADGLSDVLGMVEDGVDALTALVTYAPAANLLPLAQAFAADLATAVLAVAEGLREAGVLANSAIMAAGEMADVLGDVLSVVGDGVDALVALAAYIPSSSLGATAQQFAADLALVITTIVNALQAAGVLANSAVVAAGGMGDAIEGVVGVVGPAVEAVVYLVGYVQVSGLQAATQQFAADLVLVVTTLANAFRDAGLATNQAVVQAGELAGALSDLLGVVEPALHDDNGAITLISKYIRDANLQAKAQQFIVDLIMVAQTLVDGLIQSNLAIGVALAKAGEMAESLKSLFDAIKPALGAIEEIAAYTTTANLNQKAQQFTEDLIALATIIVTGLSTAANQLGAPAIEAAEGFALAANAIVTAVSAAFASLTELADIPATSGLIEKTTAFTQLLIGATLAMAAALTSAAQTIGVESMTAAGQFATAAATLLDSVGVALGSLSAIGEVVLASGIVEKVQAFGQQLIAVATFLAQGLSAAAVALGTTAIAAAVEFANSASQILTAVNTALGTMIQIGDNELTAGLSAKIQAFSQELITVTTALALGLGAAAAQLGPTTIADAIQFATNAAAIGTAVNTALQAIIAIAENNLAEGVAGKIQSLGTALVIVATVLASSLAAAAAAIGAATVAAAIQFATSVATLAGEVQGAVSGLAQLAGLAVPNIQPILNYIVASAQQIQTAFSTAGDIGQAVAYAAAFRANLTALVAEVQGAVAQLNALAGTGTAGSVGAALANIAQSLQNTEGQFAGAGTALANALIASLTAGVNGGQGAVIGAVVNTIDAARGAGESAARGFDGVGAAIVGAIADGVGGGQGQLIGAVTGVINAAIAAGAAAARSGASIGQQLIAAALAEVNNGRGQLDTAGGAAGDALIDGMARAITNGRSRVVNAIIETVRAAINAAQQALGIASPSKVAIELLSNFMNTAARTVEGLRGRLSDSMTDAVSGAAAAAAASMRRVRLSPPVPVGGQEMVGDSLRERAAAAVTGRGANPGLASTAASSVQVVFYGNVVLPNVTDSRSFLEELDALRGGVGR